LPHGKDFSKKTKYRLTPLFCKKWNVAAVSFTNVVERVFYKKRNIVGAFFAKNGMLQRVSPVASKPADVFFPLRQAQSYLFFSYVRLPRFGKLDVIFFSVFTNLHRRISFSAFASFSLIFAVQPDFFFFFFFFFFFTAEPRIVLTRPKFA
jgi:hypothetical protein